MMKRNILSILSVFLVASLFVMTFVSAVGPPTLSSIPEPRWVADGTTQYKVKIVADNGPMAEITPGIQLQYNLPQVQGYQFNVQSIVVRPTNDFFAGFNTLDLVSLSQGRIGRLTFSGGPMNVQGNVAYLWVTVSRTDVTAGPVQAKFTFNDDPEMTYFLNSNAKSSVAPTLISQPFTVVPVGYAVHPNGPTGVNPEDPVKTRCTQIGSIIRNRC